MSYLNPEQASLREAAQAEPVQDIADPGQAGAEDVAVKVNEVLARLRSAGIVADPE